VPHGVGDARVLDLHRHPAPVGQHRAVHLPDRRGCGGVVLELLEQLLDGVLPLLVEDLLHLLPRHRRRLAAQLGELLLV
jgi:hypothetical protein